MIFNFFKKIKKMEVNQTHDKTEERFSELKEETLKLAVEIKAQYDLIKTQNKNRHDVFRNSLIEKINSALKDNIKDMDTNLNKLICQTKFRLYYNCVFLDKQIDLEKEESYMLLDDVENFLYGYFRYTPLRVTYEKITKLVDCCCDDFCSCKYNDGKKEEQYIAFSFFIRDT